MDLVTMLTLAVQEATLEIARRNSETQATLAHLAEIMMAPKTIVRDSMGRPAQLVPQRIYGQMVN